MFNILTKILLTWNLLLRKLTTKLLDYEQYYDIKFNYYQN